MSEISTALNRFGLGARAGEPVPNDARRWLLHQFDRFDPQPLAIANRPGAREGVAKLVAYRQERRALVRAARRQGQEGGNPKAVQENLQAAARESREVYLADVAARAQVAIESDTPFVERLVHFWSNHFAVSAAKAQALSLVGSAEFEVIRPNVLGNFRTMLREASLHPAMLLYLDQVQSVGPGSPAARRGNRRQQNGGQLGLNENLAREIMELHTLGVEAGYSQADVTEFARALTGYTFAGFPQLRRAKDLANGSAYARVIHEPGPRIIMGKRYAQEYAAQAQAVLDDFASHPATARHIATKLARHFAADDPPPALVARLERAFIESDGDLPTVYRALIDAPEPWQLAGSKFRTPWEWSIGALRGVGSGGMNPRRFLGMQRELGQPVWGPPSPQGFPDTSNSWAAPDALIRRIEVAARLAENAPTYDVAALAGRLFPEAINETTDRAIARAESPAQALALLLSSPEMMRR
ncbi:DUF1800 domain-containing protein [Parerythrobacter aestuarii]|uniref:DUF1800 domain-containing protein n=1 Tax=Parerythrobacter aestuarii TaxID=3020909 RepID=UPI0024DEAAF3|nr:DUF1800 domain-containing protein [Parerythrobacter aestuarii]